MNRSDGRGRVGPTGSGGCDRDARAGVHGPRIAGAGPGIPGVGTHARGDGAIAARYRRYVRGRRLFIVAALGALLAAAFVAAGTGAIAIPFPDVLAFLARGARRGAGRIVWDLRMPRILAAALAGAGLSAAGTVMQSVLRNQLASPYTLGLSSAAACGAAFAIVFLAAGTSGTSSIVVTDPRVVTLCAFAFSMAAAVVVLLLAGFTRVSAEGMVLAGIAIGAMFAAGLTLIQYLADSVQLANIISWTFGDLGRSDWSVVLAVAAAVVPSWAALYALRWRLNAMDGGDEVAVSLGVNAGTVRVATMVIASFVSAVIVSSFGIIAFVGLLAPHIARRLVSGDQRFLLVAAPLAGAIILVVADTVARVVVAPMVLPVGILTSLLGGPLFVVLLIGRSGR